MAGRNQQAGRVPPSRLIPESGAKRFGGVRQLRKVSRDRGRCYAIVGHERSSSAAVAQLRQRCSEVQPHLTFVGIKALKRQGRLQFAGEIKIQLLESENDKVLGPLVRAEHKEALG